jgi:hypothetical protein
VSDDANRRMVADAIRPVDVVAVHVPPADVATIAPTLRDAHGRVAAIAQPGLALAIDH